MAMPNLASSSTISISFPPLSTSLHRALPSRHPRTLFAPLIASSPSSYSSSIRLLRSMAAASSPAQALVDSSPPQSETLGNAVVVGGGPAGCLMAHYLLRRGFHVHLFEQRPAVPPVLSTDNGAETGGLYTPGDPRSYPIVITSRAIKALEGVGLQLPPSLLKSLVGSCVNLPGGRKVRLEYSDNPGLQSFAVSRNALVEFLQQSLLQRKFQNLSAYFGWELSGISNNKTTAFFCPHKRHLLVAENNSTVEGKTLEVEFDLLVGADGVSSKVRSELIRLDKINQQNYGAIKTDPMSMEFVKNPESYKSFYIRPSLARESSLFADHDRVQSWTTLNMLLVNVSDGSFWGGSKNAELLSASSPSEVERMFRENAPEVLDLLLQENPKFPEDFLKQPSISFGGAVKLSRFHDNNILLIGDAAHAMFPSYGTGCNAALEDCLLFDNILAELTPSGEVKPPICIATAEFTKRRLVDAHAIVEMNSNLILFSRGTLGFLQTRFFTTLRKWFPNLFGPTAYQLLWSDVPFSKIKVKRYLENAFFYTVLALLGTILVVALVVALKRIGS